MFSAQPHDSREVSERLQIQSAWPKNHRDGDVLLNFNDSELADSLVRYHSKRRITHPLRCRECLEFDS